LESKRGEQAGERERQSARARVRACVNACVRMEERAFAASAREVHTTDVNYVCACVPGMRARVDEVLGLDVWQRVFIRARARTHTHTHTHTHVCERTHSKREGDDTQTYYFSSVKVRVHP